MEKKRAKQIINNLLDDFLFRLDEFDVTGKQRYNILIEKGFTPEEAKQIIESNYLF